MSLITKQRAAYVLVITILYFLIRNVAERSMDGAWLPFEKWWQTALEGIAVGVVLILMRSGKDDQRMPN